MGYRLSHARPFQLFVASALLAALTGCTTDRYLMVPKENLGEVKETVENQKATLETMQEDAATRHDQLLDKNSETTQTILQAITTEIEKTSCPAPEKTTECPSTQQDEGRADRLDGMVVIGQLEKFYLADPGLVYTARIDSGANTSSIYARNIQRFERDGNNWVRFEVPVPGDDSEEWVTLEKEISRDVRIIQASSDDSERRAVVELQFAIGDYQQVAEFTLADREHLSYDVLIGRNILRDVMLVDVGKEFSTELPSSYLDNGQDGETE